MPILQANTDNIFAGKKVKWTELIIITWSCFVIKSLQMLLPARGIHTLLSKQPWKHTQRLNSKPRFCFLLSISNQIAGKTTWANARAVLHLPSSAGITPRFLLGEALQGCWKQWLIQLLLLTLQRWPYTSLVSPVPMPHLHLKIEGEEYLNQCHACFLHSSLPGC